MFLRRENSQPVHYVDGEGNEIDIKLKISGILYTDTDLEEINSHGGIMALIAESESKEGESPLITKRRIGVIKAVDKDDYPIIERPGYYDELLSLYHGRPRTIVENLAFSRDRRKADKLQSSRYLDRDSDEYKEVYNFMNTALDIAEQEKAEQENPPTDEEEQKNNS